MPASAVCGKAGGGAAGKEEDEEEEEEEEEEEDGELSARDIRSAAASARSSSRSESPMAEASDAIFQKSFLKNCNCC
jgi:hypothetical protein